MAEDKPHLLPAGVELPAAGTPGAFDRFLELTVWDVEAAAERARTRTSAGTTWVGLFNVMMRLGCVKVGDIGVPAARSWAAHLGVVGEAKAAAREPAGGPPDL
jgi:hypothetical protein